MLILFVGDNTKHTADCAKRHDEDAFLIDFSNWKKILELQDDREKIVGYTSLSDLPKIDEHMSVLWNLLEEAHEIHYVPPERWSDHKNEFSWSGQKTLTEFYLYHCHLIGKKVIGLDFNDHQPSRYLELECSRANDQSCLWINGCSIAHGVGVDPDERFGEIIGKSLSMPTCHLTRGGSSLEWQADQILRSDIRAGDIVIWGLTQEIRAPQARNGRIHAWPDDTIEDVNYRLHETRYYKAITSVHQVINFCKKIDCNLIVLPFICSEKLWMDLIHEPAFYSPPYRFNFLDLGTDNLHPGPQQHRAWADFCIDIIKSKGW